MGDEAGTENVEATVLNDDDGNPTAVMVDLPEGGETAGSEAVAIAQIEADKEITLAAIRSDDHAATLKTEQNIARERNAERDEEKWHDVMQLMTNMQEQVQAITLRLDLLTLPASPVVETIAEAVAEEATTISTPQSMSEEPSPMQTEAIDVSEAESPPPEAPRRRVRFL